MSENKRYFKKMWEEEFYIFDSQVISEKEFDEKVEYEDYQAFADSLMGDEVVDRLNELDKENRKLTNELNLSKLNLKEKNEGFDKLHKMYIEQIEENKELKSLCKVLIKHIEKNSIAFVIDEEVRRLLE